MQERVEMVHVGRAVRCACGEDLRSGERAGQLGSDPELLCLWCLADLQAGRGRPRRRRVPTRWPAPAVPQPATRRTPRTRRPRGSPAKPVALALLVVAAGFSVHLAVFGRSESNAVVGGASVPWADVPSWVHGPPLGGGGPPDARDIWPPAPPDARTQPLGPPPPSLSSSTDYAFMRTLPELGGRPVTWDPFRPIHLVVNNAEAPAGANELIREASDSVSSATGLQFVIDGTTTEAPTNERAPVDNARYGGRWSPVLVAWTDPAVVPELHGRVAGVAGPVGAPYYTASQQHWVSGTVNLDGPQFREILQRGDGRAAARAIVMHEFGHLVGLDHVPSRDELMYESNIGQTAFGAGDREGLRQLGLGVCFTN